MSSPSRFVWTTWRTSSGCWRTACPPIFSRPAASARVNGARTCCTRAGKGTAMTKLRVFLADNHAVVRAGLKSLVNAQPDMEVTGEVDNGQSACEQIPHSQPDVVVLEVSLPV